jgi:hypothetical protein
MAETQDEITEVIEKRERQGSGSAAPTENALCYRSDYNIGHI